MTERFALISPDYIVANVIRIDPRSLDYSGPSEDAPPPYAPPEGFKVIQSDTAEIGDQYIDGAFISNS